MSKKMPTILLMTSNASLKKRIADQLLSSGQELVFNDDPKVPDINRSKTSFILADANSKNFSALVKQQNSGPTAVALHHADADDLVKLITSNPSVDHWLGIPKDGAPFNLVAELTKFSEYRKNGLAKNLLPLATPTTYVATNQGIGVKGVVDALHQDLNKLNAYPDFAAQIATAVWEMLANSARLLPNIRQQAAGDTLLATRETQEIATVRYSRNATHMTVAVEDRFGTLNKARVIQSLSRCLTAKRDEQVKKSPKGAGIGLYMTLHAAISVDFIMHAGKSTTVAIGAPILKNLKDFQQYPKSLNFFTKE